MLADRMKQAQPSATKAATARAASLRAEGRDIIILSQGEPDFDTPPTIREAGIRAIEAGKTRYTPVAGIPELRSAICAKLERDYGLSYSPADVTVGCGAKQVIFNALLATLDPGDEVLIPSPCWVSYPEMVHLAGGQSVIVDCAAFPQFKLTPEALQAAITPRTKWLMLNSPHNPTGSVYSKEELEALAEVLRRHPRVWILSDDIYEKIVYAPASFAALPAVAPDLVERALVVNGLSKSSCMTGWRVGYGAGPAELVKAINTIQGQTTSHTCSISQWAAVEALTGPEDHVREATARFQVRRDLLVSALGEVRGLDCSVPDGAFYLFPNCAGLLGRQAPDGTVVRDDSAFAAYLLEAAGVAVVPGSSFLAPSFIRISYASSDDELKRAAIRIADACARLR